MFHDDPKLNDMLSQMINQNQPLRLVYQWVVQRHLSFREFMDLMKTYERMVQH